MRLKNEQRTVVARRPVWRPNKFGAVSCYIRGIGLHLDITHEKKQTLPFGWEVELGDAYEFGRAPTIEDAKEQAKESAMKLLKKTLSAVEQL